jgi:hypothetical protein
MHPAGKTVAFAAAAGALLLGAVLTAPRERPAEVFGDLGEPFYPRFTDASAATALEVVEYDEGTATARPFKVDFKDGRWTIPSHYNYPADGKDRLKRTAAAVIDLRKDKIRSDNPQLHESFGVIDPVDPKVTTLKGRGKRVTVKDRDGVMLADFVFGKETGDGAGAVYVRIPEQKRVYEIKSKPDISARFEDWIETDLLQLSQYAVRKVVIDKYSIDERQGILKDREVLMVQRETSDGAWKVSEMKGDQVASIGEKEEPHADNLREVMSALDDLKIVGVRPKPAGLTRDLRFAGEFKVKEKMTPEQLAALQSLQQVGYFVTREGDLVSNEGEVQVSCDDGIAYTLRFGEVLVGEGDFLTAGKEPEKKEGEPGEKKGTENRYLFVTARFDEALLPAEPAAPPEVKADPNRKPEEQKADEEKAKKDQEEHEKKKKERDEKVTSGKKRAQDLTDRFADWYYVISADYFKKLRKSRADLVKPKEEKKEEEKK